MTRHTALTLLLRCLTDLDYHPPTWTGQLVQRQSRPGEGPSTRIECHNCKGEGQTRRRGLPIVCEVCAGRGWLVVDAYTRRQIGTAETGVVQQLKALRCEFCFGSTVLGCHNNNVLCKHCNGSGWVEVPVQRLTAVRVSLSADAGELGPGDPVIAAMERRDKAGDFEQLGLALGALRLEHRPRYRLVVRTYVEALQEPEDLPSEFQVSLRAGINYLAALMPEEIRVPSWAARNERRRREKLKRRAKEEAAA